MSMQDKVLEFHKAFGLHIAPGPGLINNQAVRSLRVRLLNEEFGEYLEGEDNNDFYNIAKELADILYIAFGTAVAYGIPLEAVFDEVHRSNMSKLGEDGKPIYREDGKVLKGPNYTQADVKKVIDEVS